MVSVAIISSVRKLASPAVEQHRNVGVVRPCEIEAEVDVLLGFRIRELDPRNAAHHVGTERHRFMHQAVGAGILDDALLGEGNDLQFDDAAKLLAHRDQGLHAFEARLAIDIGKLADVQIAVKRGQRYRGAGIPRDPGDIVVGLDQKLARSIAASAFPMPAA